MSYSIGIEAAPFVPQPARKPGLAPASIDVYKRQLRAARARPFNRVRAADLESESGAFRDHWREALLAAERNAAARAREAEIWRQVDALREEEDFYAKRAAFRMAQDRERFYAARAAVTPPQLRTRASLPAPAPARRGDGPDPHMSFRYGGVIVGIS